MSEAGFTVNKNAKMYQTMYETIINCIFVFTKKMVYSYKNGTSLKRLLFTKKMVIPVNTVFFLPKRPPRKKAACHPKNEFGCLPDSQPELGLQILLIQWDDVPCINQANKKQFNK